MPSILSPHTVWTATDDQRNPPPQMSVVRFPGRGPPAAPYHRGRSKTSARESAGVINHEKNVPSCPTSTKDDRVPCYFHQGCCPPRTTSSPKRGLLHPTKVTSHQAISHCYRRITGTSSIDTMSIFRSRNPTSLKIKGHPVTSRGINKARYPG